MSKQVYDRKQQGELIAQTKGSIKILDNRNYVVNSQSGDGSYNNIQLTKLGFICSCATMCTEVSNVNAFML